MITVTYINNREESIVLKDYVIGSNQYQIQSYNDEPLQVTRVTSQGYQQNGQTFKYNQANQRGIDFRVRFLSDSFYQSYEQEEQFKTIFNPMLATKDNTGKLIFNNEYIEREIDVVVLAQPAMNWGKSHNVNEFAVALEADFPFFRDMQYTEISLVGVAGGYEFASPSFDYEQGTSYTKGDISGSSGVITNKGHIPAPLLFEWTGQAVNPKVTLENTGEFILLNYSPLADEQIIITTGYGDKNAYIKNTTTGDTVKNNSIVDESSTFFQAPIGESTISFSATSGGQSSVVSVKYKQLWI